MDKIFDIGIIGAGPAGMTAALYAARANKSIALIDKESYGGNIAQSPRVCNIPGFSNITGLDYAEMFFKQLLEYPIVEFIMNEVALLDYNHGLIKIIMQDNDFVCCKSLIIASGMTHRKLNLPTENIYYCATCDGPFFKNKNVIVVGSGNTGTTYALELATYCKNVAICDVTETPMCEAVLAQQMHETPNITWYPKSTITSVKNVKGKLSKVVLTNGKEVSAAAIFAAIGMIPNTSFVGKFANCDEFNFIKADETCSIPTVPGVFVAGDVRTKMIRQVVTAEADGATAAQQAIKFLNALKR